MPFLVKVLFYSLGAGIVTIISTNLYGFLFQAAPDPHLIPDLAVEIWRYAFVVCAGLLAYFARNWALDIRTKLETIAGSIDSIADYTHDSICTVSDVIMDLHPEKRDEIRKRTHDIRQRIPDRRGNLR